MIINPSNFLIAFEGLKMPELAQYRRNNQKNTRVALVRDFKGFFLGSQMEI